MNVIHKATVKVGVNSLYLPMNAVILSAHEQNGSICIWYHCDDVSDTTSFSPRQIDVVGTGWPEKTPALESHRFIGTVLIMGYVWHVFEMKS